MNILYLCADPGIPIRSHKGSAIHVRALINALSRLGHQVSLLTPRAGPVDGPTPEAQLFEVRVPDHSSSPTEMEREQLAITTAQDVYRAGKELLAWEAFDFIYERYSLWSDAGARLANESGLPLVVEINAPLRLEASRYRSLINAELAAAIEKNLIKVAAILVVVSEPIKKYLLELGASPDKILVLPNGVDEQYFHPAVDGRPVRSRLGLEHKFVVGFVGTARPWHDLDALIESMAILKSKSFTARLPASPPLEPYHLLLVGNFPPRLVESIQRHNLVGMTTIVDSVPNCNVPDYLAAMNVAVSPHPAMPDFYFSPLKLFEYLACGVPTVAADLPPLADVIEPGENGLLYLPGSPHDLATQISALADDPVRSEKMGMRGAKKVLSDYTWVGNAQKIIRHIHQADGNNFPEIPSPHVAQAAPVWDEKIGRALYQATRTDLVNKALAGVLAENGLKQINGWKIIKYRPGRRCVIAYQTDSEIQPAYNKQIIGKIFYDGRGARYFDVQKEMWSNGFGPNAADHITVSRPVAYLPELNMFVQEFAPGSSLEDFTGQPDFEEKVRVSAAALVKLHANKIVPTVTYSVFSELTNLDKWALELCNLRPGLAPLFKFHLADLHALGEALPAVEHNPVHRDFYYGQILFSNDRTTLIDFDLMSFGDGAIDVANFAAHLQFLAIQKHANLDKFGHLAKFFIQEYLALRPMSASAPRLAFYEAATFFRLLHVALMRPHFSQYFETLMELCNQKIRIAMDIYYGQTENQIS